MVKLLTNKSFKYILNINFVIMCPFYDFQFVLGWGLTFIQPFKIYSFDAQSPVAP